MPPPALMTRLLPALVLSVAVMPAAARAAALDAAMPAETQADLPAFLSTFYTEGGGGGSTVKTTWTTAIAVSEPAYCASISGDTTVSFKAPGMTTVHALCWQQPTADHASPWGHDMELAPHLTLAPDGTGSFVFHADQFPNGPIILRLFAKDGGSSQDYCELQLFNRGGVTWNQGIPGTPPAPAQGMRVTFSDDFAGPLSITRDRTGTYWTHWGGGDGSSWGFGENEGPTSPFSLVKGATKSFLRIHASKPDGAHGITGSLTTNHATGKAPCYIECRFLAQNAKGTWPGFWMTAKHAADLGTSKGPCDEIDVIEAYGTNSSSGGIWTAYHATTHFWGQPDPVWIKDKAKGPDGNPYAAHRMVPSMQLGGKTAWSTTFHTYGVLITPAITAYYLDGIEVLRHPSGEVSASEPFSVIVNLAIGGGGWKADLQRYGNQSDMWVDYLRIFQGGETAH